MKLFIIFCVVLLAASIACAQNALPISVKNQEAKQAVSGAEISVKDADISALTDENGKAELKNIPDGEQPIQIFPAGYAVK